MIPNVFANETSPSTGELDENFQFVAALGIGPCTVAGTNTIALTPTASAVVIAGYQDFGMFAFRVAVTSTGPVTINYNGLGALPALLPSGTQVDSGNFTAGDFVIVARDSVAGCFHVVSAPVTGSPPLLLDLLGSTRGSILYRGASGWTILAPGTSGFLLASQGAGADPHYVSPAAAGAGGYTAVRATVTGNIDFGASFPTATAATRFRITAVGAGAGGGGVDTTNGAKAGGGASGQWVSGVYSGLNGLVLPVTIGTGGAGGANTGAAGTNGGATLFGSGGVSIITQSSSGGSGSTSATGASAGGGAGSVAGTVSGASLVQAINTFGQQSGGIGINGTGTTGVSGSGGSTPWGAGGANLSGAGSNAGHGFGAGGSGASDSAGVAAVGGAGTDGMVLVEAWL